MDPRITKPGRHKRLLESKLEIRVRTIQSATRLSTIAIRFDSEAQLRGVALHNRLQRTEYRIER